MYETERQTLQRCCDLLTDKGWRKPSAEIHIAEDVLILARATHPISDSYTEQATLVQRGETLQAYFDGIYRQIKDLVNEAQAKDDLLRKKLAELIDLGDKHSFDALIMQTLRDEMKKLSENILEDKS